MHSWLGSQTGLLGLAGELLNAFFEREHSMQWDVADVAPPIDSLAADHYECKQVQSLPPRSLFFSLPCAVLNDAAEYSARD